MDSNAYTAWKAWTPKQFGFCSRVQRKYFQAEMSRTSLDLTKIINILEIGFGNGSFLTYAHDRGWCVEGIEIIESLVLKAREQGFCAFTPAKILSLKSQNYDLITAFDVFEHLLENDLDLLFADINRLLCTGGCLVARFPNGDSPFGLEGQNGDPTHLTAIGVSKIRYYATKHGFDVVFLGSEARPVAAGSSGLMLRRLVTLPIMWLLDRAVQFIFLPGSGICFSSRNITAVLKKCTN